jgi:putative ABC transport system permease protein
VARHLAQLPGVLAVTANSAPPLAGRTNNLAISTNTSSELGSASPTAERDVVFPNYFGVMGIRLISGRAFSAGDVADASRVAIVSQAMVDRFWPGQSVIGRQFRHPMGIATIVGVIADVRNKSLDEPAGAKYYVPFDQEGARLSFILRTREAPALLIPPAQQAIWQSVPGSTVAEVRTMDAMMDADLAPERYRALLASSFAFAALLITAVGVSGLTARGITARMKELCVRMALGSTPAGALVNGIRGTVGAVAVGVAAGLAVSPIALSLLRSYLYQVSSWDPPTLGVATAAMLGVALAAAALASRRLLSADLVTILRGD